MKKFIFVITLLFILTLSGCEHHTEHPTGIDKAVDPTTVARSYYKDSTFIKQIEDKYWFKGTPLGVGQYGMFYVSIKDDEWYCCLPYQYPFGCFEKE